MAHAPDAAPARPVGMTDDPRGREPRQPQPSEGTPPGGEAAGASAAPHGLDPEAVGRAIDALKRAPPRVHALVSGVAQPLVANAAAAVGIDISMTIDAGDVKVMAQRADVLLINLGMFDRARREGAASAVATGCPFVLDPVKVDRAPDRLVFARTLIAAGPRIVKGNVAEMAALAGTPMTGVRVTTGERDTVEAGARRVAIDNGTPLLAAVVATGCATGALIAAMSAVETDPFLAAAAGLSLMAVAGELAAARASGPGSFAVALLDALAAVDGAAVAAALEIHDG